MKYYIAYDKNKCIWGVGKSVNGALKDGKKKTKKRFSSM